MVTEERRESGAERVPARRPVAICTARENGLIRGETRDLSSRGMLVDVEGPLAAGDSIVFRLDLGKDFAPVVHGGRVAWTSASETATTAGIRFVSLANKVPQEKLDATPPPPPAGFEPGEELRIKVGGMSQALKGEFVGLEGEVLRFRCPLPFLKLRSPVVVASAVAVGKVFEGEVHGVQAGEADDGVPELVVTVGPLGGSVEAVAAGPVAAAGLPCAVSAPAPVRESPTVEVDLEAPGVEVAPVALRPSVEASRATRPAVPPPPAPVSRPSRLESLRGLAQSGAWRKAPVVLRGLGVRWLALARAFGRAAAPRLRRFGGLCVAFARTVAGLLRSLFGRGARKWRRSRLPTTYAEVVASQGRAPAPPVASRRLVNWAAASMAAVGLALGIWGLLGTSGAKGGTRDEASGAGPGAETAPAGGWPTAPEALPEVPSAWPTAGEPGAELPAPAEPVAVAPEAPAEEVAAPPPPREASESEAPASASSAGPSRPNVIPGAAGASIPGGQAFTIRLDGAPARVTNYGLRQPPGIVIDVEGAALDGGAAQVDAGINAVRLVKAVPRDSGTRFVVYLRGRTLRPYALSTNGSEITVTVAP